MSTEQIKARAARADQMIAGLKEQTMASSTPGDAPLTPADPAYVAPVEPAPNEPALNEPAHNDPGSLSAPPSEPSPRASDAAVWEQRYRSLDGMIKARDRTIAQLQDNVVQLQAMLASMQQPAPAPTPTERLVTEQDEEAFGADLVDLARRAAREEQSAYIAQLEQRVQQLTDQMQGVAQSSAQAEQDRFLASLDRLCPQWRTLDPDPGFNEWLRASTARSSVFNAAASARNAGEVAEFFNEYAARQEPAKGAKPANDIDPRLAAQLAPGRSRSASRPSDAGDKRTWTRTAIAAFFKDGRKQYDDDTYARLERDIYAAQREGRVIYTK